ncbi:MAG: tRNA (N(6)-L-threonylcarbamoyladenosine(37)-C(2))-methylthiotransferase MtaB [Ruminococcus sp.]|nr:tRNA (N(6)-L-threonylcarbamoyladenosine(37)-C(2))-methylthiotransferase MtaB [Ruminococcus sp.]
MYKVFFITFGCKVNQYETECMKADLLSKGFESAESADVADVILLNSCTVTSSGDSKSLYALRKLRKDRPDALIVLTGCLPQASPEIADSIPEADIIAGTKNRSLLSGMILEFLEHRQRIVEIARYGASESFEDLVHGDFTGKTRAFVKIQDGCNQFCSYCIIPFARGRCRSKPLEVLRDELKMLADAGHREIVLVGINLAFYGMEYGLRLADAVEECCRISGIERVRLGSLEPEVISDDDLLRLSRCPQFCPQFHLSLQSGSDSVLRRMNRRYTTAEYYDLVCRIRKIFPDASFTTDIMTGFPEETEEEFVQSLEFAEKVGFAKIHVFQYSPRKGTVAEKMPQLSKKIKAERADRLKALGSQLQEKYLRNLVGKTVPVLFERENSTEFHHGYAPDYTLIKISRKNSKKSLRNFIFYVTIEEAHNDYCYGTICEP